MRLITIILGLYYSVPHQASYYDSDGQKHDNGKTHFRQLFIVSAETELIQVSCILHSVSVHLVLAFHF